MRSLPTALLLALLTGGLATPSPAQEKPTPKESVPQRAGADNPGAKNPSAKNPGAKNPGADGAEADRAAPTAEAKALADKQRRMADALEEQGDNEGALQILENLSEKNPGDETLHQRIAEIHLRADRFAEAFPHLRQMLEIRGGSEGDYTLLIQGMVQAGLAEEALVLFKDAAARFPKAPGIAFLGTYLHASAERWEEAIDCFEKTIALTEKDQRDELLDERFHFRYAVAQERAGHVETAVKLLQKSLDLIAAKPRQEDGAFEASVLNYLAYLWIERGENLADAGEMALAAAELDPGSGAIADTVGWWHFQSGDYPRALASLKKAERLVPEPDPVIFDHLGQTLAKLKESSFAADYFRRALELDPGNAELKARLAEVAP